MSTVRPRRRWLAFRLRTLFVVVTLLACWLGWELRIVRERQAMLRWVEEHRGSVDEFDQPGTGMGLRLQTNRRKFPAMRRLFGDAPIAFLLFYEPEGRAEQKDVDRISAMFPEAIAGIIPAPPDGIPDSELWQPTD